MSFSMKVEGGTELAKRLEQLPAAVSRRAQIDALKAGAEPIRSRAASLAPRGEGPGPHLADHIVVSVGRRTPDGAVSVLIGPAKNPIDVFWGFFQEFGTAFIGAQPFMRPAFDGGVQAGLGIIVQHLWTSIRKHLSLGGGSPATTGGRFG